MPLVVALIIQIPYKIIKQQNSITQFKVHEKIIEADLAHIFDALIKFK
jgi:hypothetical protein